MTDAARYVLQSTYITTREHITDLVSALKTSSEDRDGAGMEYVGYISDNNDQVIELIGFSSWNDIGQFLLDRGTQQHEDAVRRKMTHDVRREVLQLHTDVKPGMSVIPGAAKLQVRYIEVPGMVLDEYFEWRTGTIFAHVIKRADIHSFRAYHSLASSTPGVTFFVEYEGEYDDLMAGFGTPEYKDIIRQADRFIVGGNINLSTQGYTRIYRSPSLANLPASRRRMEA